MYNFTNQASYVNELLGNPKKPESLSQLVSSKNILQLKWGRIDVRFKKSWSLKSFIEQQMQKRTFSTPFKPQEAALFLRVLGYRVLSDINEVSVIMPSSLVGTALLTLRGRGSSRVEILERVEWIKKQILKKCAKVAEFGDNTAVIFDRVISNLGADLIGSREELSETVYFVKKRFELSYYRNNLMHCFVIDALVCTSILACERSKTAASREELIKNTKFISQMLKREFIYPEKSVDTTTDETVTSLIENGVITSIDNVIDWEKFEFYCFLLFPFIETYWLGCLSLLILDPFSHSQQQFWALEKDFFHHVQQFAKTLYYEGELNYFESINAETLKNAVRVNSNLVDFI